MGRPQSALGRHDHETIARLPVSWKRFVASFVPTLPLFLAMVFRSLQSGADDGTLTWVILGIGLSVIWPLMLLIEGPFAGILPFLVARGETGSARVGRVASFIFRTRKRLALIDGRLAIGTAIVPWRKATNMGRNNMEWKLTSGQNSVASMAPFGVTDALREQIQVWGIRNDVAVDFIGDTPS